MPGGLDLVQAAGVPETFFTVWNGMVDQGRLAAGETILIHGGASGIGTTAIMLAKTLGARAIYTTAGSPEKCATCLKLGATAAFNYRTQDFVGEVKAATQGLGVDVILDIVAGDYVPKNISLLADDGRLVFMGQMAELGDVSRLNFEANIWRIMFSRLTITGMSLRGQSIDRKAAIGRELERRILAAFRQWLDRPAHRQRVPPGPCRRCPSAPRCAGAHGQDDHRFRLTHPSPKLEFTMAGKRTGPYGFLSIAFGIVAAAMLVARPAAAQQLLPLKIGVIATLSGSGTQWGLAAQRAVEIAVDEVNEAGGLKIGGKLYTPIPVVLDDQFSATGGKTAAERLVNSDGVKFIIGPVGSPAALGAITVTNAAGVLTFTSGFAPAILKNDAKAAYNYRIGNSSAEFAPPLIDWLKKTYPQVKTVAVVVPNDATGQTAAAALTAIYKRDGFEVWNESYERGTKEFTPLLTRMVRQGVDALDLNSNSPGDAGLLIKQSRQVGYRGMIWEVGGPTTQENIDIAGKLANGMLSYEFLDYDAPAAAQFAARYHTKWSGSINGLCPLFYNSAKIMFEAMRRAGTTDVDKVRDTLNGLDGYDPGLLGPVRWGGLREYGVDHQLLTRFIVVEIKEGKPVVRATLQPE